MKLLFKKGEKCRIKTSKSIQKVKIIRVDNEKCILPYYVEYQEFQYCEWVRQERLLKLKNSIKKLL